MANRKDAWTFLLVSSLILLVISLPYLAAARAGNEDYVFTGLLQNPIDGNSYLAKMYQGWQGEWTFTLPYTATPGEGTYLFLFYLFLGHLARVSGLSTVLVFHLARLASAAFLLLALWRFYGAALPESGLRRLAFAIAGLGSGLGWLAALAGGFTADFWVAEAYPFLGAYANPHFPLGLALVLVLVAPAARVSQPGGRFTLVWNGLAGFLLGIAMPFGVVVAALVLAGALAWEKGLGLPGQIAVHPAGVVQGLDPASFSQRLRARYRRQPGVYQGLFGMLAGSAPVLLYDFWVANTHPVLSDWNAQNLTPAPPLWDVFLSFSPVLWLAVVGAWTAWRSGGNGLRLLLTWAGLGLLLLYLPFGLQRRFILGLYVPLAGLGALGISQLAGGNRWRGAFLAGAFFLLALPTNVMILMAASHGIDTHASPLFIAGDERRAMEWVQANTPEEAVILAAPETGLWIPARTGRRVLAGHPFETVEAETRAEQVVSVFKGTQGAIDLPWVSGVDYVYIGPRERELGGSLPSGDWHAVYRQGGVTIWGEGP